MLYSQIQMRGAPQSKLSTVLNLVAENSALRRQTLTAGVAEVEEAVVTAETAVEETVETAIEKAMDEML